MSDERASRISLAEFTASLRRVKVRAALAESPEYERIRDVAAKLSALSSVTPETIAAVLASKRAVSAEVLRVLGLAVGLSLERLTSEIHAHLSPEERREPAKVVEFLDEEFGLVAIVAEARERNYGWADLLVARAGSRQSAGSAIAGGRSVEDAIEAIAKGLGLSYELRTRFEGRGGAVSACDIAIPAGGAAAQIVCAAKGFDSTGSKLTAAFTEIEKMSTVRRPNQFVYAVVDGIGWHRRQSDLAEIHRLYETNAIDGLYSLSMMGRFRADLDAAATRLGIRRAVDDAAVHVLTPSAPTDATKGRKRR